MAIFQPVKIENYQFPNSGLNEYEPILVYTKSDIEDGRVYFVENMFYNKLKEWIDNNLIIEGRGRAFIDRSYGKIAINVDIQDLEYSINRLNGEVEELKNRLEKKKESRIYNLMERVGEINSGRL